MRESSACERNKRHVDGSLMVRDHAAPEIQAGIAGYVRPLNRLLVLGQLRMLGADLHSCRTVGVRQSAPCTGWSERSS